MWEYLTPVLFFLGTYIAGCIAPYCQAGSYYSYCKSGGCCGSYGEQHCCIGYGYYSGYGDLFSGGSIAGVVVGSIISVGVIIAIIVCVCVRRQGHRGQIFGDRTTTNATVVTTGASPQMHQMGYAGSPPNYCVAAGYPLSQATGAAAPYGGPLYSIPPPPPTANNHHIR